MVSTPSHDLVIHSSIAASGYGTVHSSTVGLSALGLWDEVVGHLGVKLICSLALRATSVLTSLWLSRALGDRLCSSGRLGLRLLDGGLVTKGRISDANTQRTD